MHLHRYRYTDCRQFSRHGGPKSGPRESLLTCPSLRLYIYLCSYVLLLLLLLSVAVIPLFFKIYFSTRLSSETANSVCSKNRIRLLGWHLLFTLYSSLHGALKDKSLLPTNIIVPVHTHTLDLIPKHQSFLSIWL